jgi:hypothetical protein
VGRAGNKLLGRATHLVKLLHQVGLGVKAASGIGDEDVSTSRLRCGQCVVESGRGISTLLGLDHRNVGTLGPDLELLNGRCAEGVGSTEKNASALRAKEIGELSRGGRLAGSIDADHEDDLRGRGGMLHGARDAIEDLLELGLEDLPELGSALDAGAECALPEVLHDDGRGGAADVGGQQARFKLVE